MNIKAWKDIVDFTSIQNYPYLPCPNCLNNKLKLDQESLQTRKVSSHLLEVTSRKFKSERSDKEAKRSEQYKQLNNESGVLIKLLTFGTAFLEQLIDPLNGKPFQFCGFFCCESCNESVTCSGFYLKPNNFSSPKEEVKPFIKVEHFSPTIPLFHVSRHVPDKIKIELFDAFKHFHFDPGSSASKLRRAIEQFCEDMEAKGKNLHQKICSLKEKYPTEAEYLAALKLLGNEGTHAFDVTEIDLLHAFEVVQFVLEIYDRKARFKATQENYEQLTKKFGENTNQTKLLEIKKDKDIGNVQ